MTYMAHIRLGEPAGGAGQGGLGRQGAGRPRLPLRRPERHPAARRHGHDRRDGDRPLLQARDHDRGRVRLDWTITWLATRPWPSPTRLEGRSHAVWRGKVTGDAFGGIHRRAVAQLRRPHRAAGHDRPALHRHADRAGGARERLRDPAARVSAHYLVEEDGRVFRLVAEERRAWHAGKARWGGDSDINGCSIGIEMVNPGHEFGYRAFPEIQIAALAPLMGDIRQRWTHSGRTHPRPRRRGARAQTGPGRAFPLARSGAGGSWSFPGASRRRRARRSLRETTGPVS